VRSLGTPFNRGSNTAAATLGRVSHLLVDMDGVLFRGGTALPGASGFLPWLQNHGIAFQLITNNSTASPEKNAALLAAMGIHVDLDAVFTSAMATGRYLERHAERGERTFVIGEEGLVEAVANAGMEVVRDPEGVSWVVAGLDRHVTYEELCMASFALERGARFIATNADASLPVEQGEAPGAGALQAALVATTGVKPLVIGKPEPLLLELGMERIGGSRDNTAMLGDRLDTDIAAAARLEMTSILVLTGVTAREDLASSRIRPNVTVNGLPELMKIWSTAKRSQ